MTDRYENIRRALEMGPTPGPFSVVRSYSAGNQELIIRLIRNDEYGIAETYCTVRNSLGDTWKTEADATFIAACDPDTIRALLEERDALLAEVAEWKRVAAAQAELHGEATAQGDPLLDNPASWVIRNKETGQVVMETFNRALVDALNTTKYEAVPIVQHLRELNKEIRRTSEEGAVND